MSDHTQRLYEQHGHMLHQMMQQAEAEGREVYASQAREAMRCGRDYVRSVLDMVREHGPPTIAVAEGLALVDDGVEEETTEDLLQRREERFLRRQRMQASRTRVIGLPDNRPIGILHVGDPHLDDDGCDLPLLRSHLELARDTDGIYAGCVGDVTNNWVGKLVRLWAHQSTTRSEEVQLLTWFLTEWRWLYFVLGNHDLWNDGEHLFRVLMREAERNDGGIMVSARHEAQICLAAPNGEAMTMRIRHKFKGNSQWNSTHGLMKDAKFRPGADLLVEGHYHEYACQQTHVDGVYTTALRLNAYKRFDSYAESLQYDQNSGGEAVLTVFDPGATSPESRLTVWPDPFAGARYLTALRGEK